MLTKRERGATAVLVASTLFLMIGMAAVAIDLGAGWNELRQDQTGADLAAVGGALEAALTVSGSPTQAAVASAKAIVDANLGRTLGQAAWTNCVDPDMPASYRPSNDPSNPLTLGIPGGSPCISFGPGFKVFRVRTPKQAVPTTFARVLGVANLQVGAPAEAGFAPLGGGAYPAGVFLGQGAGTEFCIKTGTGGGSDSCGAPVTGNFGTFKPFFYTDVTPNSGINTIGVSGEQTSPLARVIGDGLDHELGLSPGDGLGTRENGSGCGNNPTQCSPAFPDQVRKSGGNQPADITSGLVEGGAYDGTYNGRLNRGPYVGKVDTASNGAFTVQGFSLDNRPLWTFIDPAEANTSLCQALETLPGDISAATPATPIVIWNYSNTLSYNVTGWDDAKAKMIQCLNGESDLLFTRELLSSARLGQVPRFWQTVDCGNNNCLWDIKEIIPIFVQDIWTDLGPQWICTGGSDRGTYCQYAPGMMGQITRTNGQFALGSASALVLGCAQMPDPPCVPVTGSGPGGQVRNLAIELTK